MRSEESVCGVITASGGKMALPHRGQTFSIETKPAPFGGVKSDFGSPKADQFISHVGEQQDYLSATAITWYVYKNT